MNDINQQPPEKITKLEQQQTIISQQEKLLRSIYDNVQEAIFIVDVEADQTFRYQGFNPAAIRLTGVENVINQTPSQILPESVAVEVEKRYRQCLQAAKTISYEECLPFQGEDTWWLTTLNPIQNEAGKIYRIIGTSLNISQRREAEQALAELNNELEARVQQRTLQLEQVNNLLIGVTNQLRKSNQELEQFAYVASHDLKAPLRAIANLSEWIEEDLADRLDDDTRHHMNLMRNRVHRLENLINGLLDYSRVGRSNSEPQSVDVGKMLTEIIDSLDVRDSCRIVGDMPTFVTTVIPLQQVFTNLISNAIKHGERDNNQITISVEEQDDCYRFAVSDQGKGIDPKYHDRIFTIFQTLEARDTKESTGIGLAIVKKAVENQNGTIEVESQLNQGATFRFTWNKISDS